VARKKLVAAMLGGVILLALLAGGVGGERAPVAKARSVAIFFSGDIQGRLVPCTCEEGPLGGAARMASVYQRWKKECPRRIIVDVGNATVPTHQAADAVNRLTFEALEKLGCSVVNCGVNEVALPAERLTALARGRKFRTISANLVRAGTGENVLPAHHVVRRGRRRVGFIGLLRNDIPPQRIGKGLRLTDPGTALKASLGALDGRADLIVVLCCLPPEQMYALASGYPKVNVFLGGSAQATSAPFELVSRTVLAYLGDNGCTVGRLEADFPRGRRPTMTGRVALLSDRVPEDKSMKSLVARFRAALGRASPPGADWDPKMPCSTSYVGADVCRLCHLKQYYKWQTTKHAGAYVTLLQAGEGKDTHCLACHTTGFRMPGGYDLEKKVPPGPVPGPKTQAPLAGVGCECCHGGSRRHLGAALKDRVAAAKAPQLRSWPAAHNCQRCHTDARPCLAPGKADPFDMVEYLNKIKHWEAGP